MRGKTRWICACFAIAMSIVGALATTNPVLVGGVSFNLVDQRGAPVTETDFDGKPVLVYFGFTYCAGVCQTMLLEASRRLVKLGDDADKIAVLFVSVDPSRDTPRQLATFLDSFDPRIHGLTGDEAEIRHLAQMLGAYARRVGAGDDYAFDHSGAGYLLDRAGRLFKRMDEKLTEEEGVMLMRRAIRLRISDHP